MPRNIPQPVPSGSASSQQAIVRPDRAIEKRSATNSHNSRRKTAKTRGSYLPEPKVLRIQQRYINGQNKSEIAREENCDRETVARIVKFPEVQTFIAEMQQQFYGLLPDAMAAVRHALQVEKNATVAYRILEATGVAPHQHERLQLPEATSSETGEERQCRMVACVLLESHANLGVDLPADVQAALAKDAQEHQDAKPPQVKVLRK